MSKEPILNAIGDVGESSPSEMSDTGFLNFLGKRLIVRLHFPGNVVKRYRVKITMHTIEIKGYSYFIHTDSFYRRRKKTYVDYYFGNPKPIILRNIHKGLLVVGDELQEEFDTNQYKDINKKKVSQEDWENLPYKEKFNTPGVFEFDGRMLNKALNYSYTNDLWGKGEGLFGGKGKWGIIIMIVIIAIVVAMVFYFKMRGGV